ncbi:MAG TPA: universal stress protein [Novimethylophilus sp.]|jgi:nucleotide-binding universal stress UspA family protein|uniref:universal stress protein n=1 Tax=Novimethylophilus sp. TaxID=2137426 RepID=UPI002F3EE182
MYKYILSPVDGSETSKRGVQEAIRLAKDQQAQLRFLCVVDTYMPAMDPGIAFDVGVLESLRKWGENILNESMAAASAAGVAAESKMVETAGGRVAGLIVEQARQWPADVIVMGTHGRRGFNHLLMGSDAEAVIRLSSVPVLLVKQDQAPS